MLDSDAHCRKQIAPPLFFLVLKHSDPFLSPPREDVPWEENSKDAHKTLTQIPYGRMGRLDQRITDDKDFGKFFLDWLFDRFRKALGSHQALKEENSKQPS